MATNRNWNDLDPEEKARLTKVWAENRERKKQMSGGSEKETGFWETAGGVIKGMGGDAWKNIKRLFSGDDSRKQALTGGGRKPGEGTFSTAKKKNKKKGK